jgi:hypothetical protein
LKKDSRSEAIFKVEISDLNTLDKKYLKVYEADKQTSIIDLELFNHYKSIHLQKNGCSSLIILKNDGKQIKVEIPKKTGVISFVQNTV